MEKLSYRIKEAVEATGIGRTSIFELIRAGHLETVKVGGCTLIPAESLRRMIASPPASYRGQVSRPTP